MNSNFEALGFLIVGLFVALWAVSYIVHKARGRGDPETASA